MSCDCNKNMFLQIARKSSSVSHSKITLFCNIFKNGFCCLQHANKSVCFCWMFQATKIHASKIIWRAYLVSLHFETHFLKHLLFSQWFWGKNCFGPLWCFLKRFHLKLGYKSPMQFIWNIQILKIKLYDTIIVWENNPIIYQI